MEGIYWIIGAFIVGVIVGIVGTIIFLFSMIENDTEGLTFIDDEKSNHTRHHET